jgi:hypothetical protein
VVIYFCAGEACIKKNTTHPFIEKIEKFGKKKVKGKRQSGSVQSGIRFKP